MTWTSRTGRLTIMAVVTVAAIAPCPTPLVAAGGKLQLNVVDSQTGEPIACRMHLKNQAGRPVKAPRQPFFHDHFVFDGTIKLELPRGNYTFELECGPEYLQRSGHFGINDFADDQKHVDMKRFIECRPRVGGRAICTCTGRSKTSNC